jgi:hypothetical protein
MNVTKQFVTLAEKVKEENNKILPEIFVADGKPAITDISKDEVGEPDTFNRYTITHKGTSVLAKLARGVDKALEAYDLQLMKSVRDIKITGQDPIPAGYQVWRLVAPSA